MKNEEFYTTICFRLDTTPRVMSKHSSLKAAEIEANKLHAKELAEYEKDNPSQCLSNLPLFGAISKSDYDFYYC